MARCCAFLRKIRTTINSCCLPLFQNCQRIVLRPVPKKALPILCVLHRQNQNINNVFAVDRWSCALEQRHLTLAYKNSESKLCMKEVTNGSGSRRCFWLACQPKSIRHLRMAFGIVKKTHNHHVRELRHSARNPKRSGSPCMTSVFVWTFGRR